MIAMQGISLKEQLLSGNPALGCWLWLCSPIAAEIVAQAGYDFVIIDLEHGPGDLLGAITLSQAAKAGGAATLLRVPSGDPVWLKRALDTGADGVVVPAIDNREQAEAVVAGCRYPPRGCRGVAPTVIRASRYGADWKDYVRHTEARTLVICQIETKTGADNASSIAGVDGVDMLFIGPFDLSADMGILGELNHPAVKQAIQNVEEAAIAGNTLLGGIATPERQASELFAAGYSFVCAGGDSTLLRDAALSAVTVSAPQRGRRPSSPR